jgi:hypothetical protein
MRPSRLPERSSLSAFLSSITPFAALAALLAVIAALYLEII